MTFGGCVEIWHCLCDGEKGLEVRFIAGDNSMSRHTYFVNSFVALRDVRNEQPKIVGELEVNRIPQVGDERVGSHRQQLELLSRLRFIVRIEVKYPPDPGYLPERNKP